MGNGYSVGNLEMSIQTVGNGAISSFSLLNKQLKNTSKALGVADNKLEKMNKQTKNTLNFATALGKIYFVVNYTKQLGRFMSELVQSAIDYTETLNLWQVAMRENVDTAEEFISKMNKAYGIAEETLMRYQATFRNMLSTLGGISTDVSYGLSEYLTQMALDYASLYNTSIEKAMTVFQSVLSGQVRPIRSISGYDITETTIFELYQQLGGTKTMRQLTQTEKRLLRIYAVFQQMDKSGAIGDLNKTLNNTSNQMRIMSEATKELGMWVGKLIELYIAPALPYLNAFFITAKNIAQAIVKSLPQYEEFDGTIKGYEETAEAMDEVQGKLLDFDKFRALDESNNNLGLGIDENLINGLEQYQSILENVTNDATILAKQWTSWWIDDNGNLTKNAKDLGNALKEVGRFLLAITADAVISGISSLAQGIYSCQVATKTWTDILEIGSIYLLLKAIEEFSNKNYLEGIAYGVGAITLGLIPLNISLNGVLNTVMPLVAGIGALIIGITSFWESWGDMGTAQKWVGILGALVAGVVALAIATNMFTGNWINGLAIAGAVAGGVLLVTSQLPKFADGGMPQKGTVFVAGEAGAEMLYNMPSGQSGVANISQIAQADYNGTRQALNDWWAGAKNDIPAFREVSKTGIYEVVDSEARRRGKAFANR